MNSNGFFLFRWEIDLGKGVRDIAIAHRVLGILDQAAYADLFEEALKGPVAPDALVLLCCACDRQRVLADLQAQVVVNAAVRFNDRLPLVLALLDPRTFQVEGYMVDSGSCAPSEHWTTAVGTRVPALLDAGLGEIFSPSSILLEAPPGFEFSKPSTKSNRYFLRAEQGLNSSTRAAFVALAVLWRLVAAKRVGSAGPSMIFVDTMGIASVAFSLRELIVASGLGQPPQIESFHSYSGIDDVRVSAPETSVCLISASTSMAMHRDWIKLKSADPQSVVTLATFEGSQDASFALAKLPAPPTDAADTDRPFKIKIFGETFVPIFEAPKQVLLKKVHRGTQNVEFLRELHSSFEVVAPFGVAESSASSRHKGIFLAADSFLQNRMGVIQAEIVNRGFGDATYIIHQDDQPSKSLADEVAKSLKCTVLDVAHLNKISDAQGKLIVLAGIVGNGTRLNDLSRDLRPIHFGDRLYLIGAHIGTTLKQMDTFRRNLALRQLATSGSSPYAIACLASIATGEDLALSFASEIDARFNQEGRNIPDVLAARLSALRRNRSSAMSVGLLPSGIDLQTQMRLRPNFTYWTPGYADSHNQATVLGAVAAVLQNAREDSNLPDVDRLSSVVLGQVRLDPENFVSRFNDGLVQGALLRAARPYEVDYRSDKECSAYFARFVIRMLNRLGDPSSEAILEFMSSLATAKLRLDQPSTAEIVRTARAICTHANALEEAIGFYADAIAVECLGEADSDQPF